MNRRKNAQTKKCTNEKMHRRKNAQTKKCSNENMQRRKIARRKKIRRKSADEKLPDEKISDENLSGHGFQAAERQTKHIIPNRGHTLDKTVIIIYVGIWIGCVYFSKSVRCFVRNIILIKVLFVVTKLLFLSAL